MESETAVEDLEQFQVKSFAEDSTINLGLIGVLVLALILSMLLLPRMMVFNGG